MEPIYYIANEVLQPNIFDNNKRLVFDFTSKDSMASELLQQCDNTALLVDHMRLLEIETVLKALGASKLSVGKEVLFEKRLGFIIKGWVPNFLRSRIRAVQSSSILEWWNKLLSVDLVKIKVNSNKIWKSQKYFNKQYNASNRNHSSITNSEYIFGIILILWLGCAVAIVFWGIEIATKVISSVC